MLHAAVDLKCPVDREIVETTALVANAGFTIGLISRVAESEVK